MDRYLKRLKLWKASFQPTERLEVKLRSNLNIVRELLTVIKFVEELISFAIDIEKFRKLTTDLQQWRSTTRRAGSVPNSMIFHLTCRKEKRLVMHGKEKRSVMQHNSWAHNSAHLASAMSDLVRSSIQQLNATRCNYTFGSLSLISSLRWSCFSLC